MKTFRRVRDALLLLAVIAIALQGTHFTARGAGNRLANAAQTFSQSFQASYNRHAK